MSKTKKAPRPARRPPELLVTLNSKQEVALSKDKATFGDIAVTTKQSAELLGKPWVGDGPVTLREVAERLGDARWASWIACGLHSGFPPCCIRFFVQTWSTRMDFDREKYRAAIAAATTLDRHQVPCRACLRAKRFVTPLPCDCAERFRAVIAAAKATKHPTRGPNKR